MAKDYRSDGFLFAYKFLHGRTVEQLEREMKYRDLTGIKTNLSFDEIETSKGTKVMIDFVCEGQDLIWAMALHNLGYGNKRIKRNLERVLLKRPSTLIDFYKISKINDEIVRKFVVMERLEVRESDYDKYKPNRYVEEYTKSRDDGIYSAIKLVKERGYSALRTRITKRLSETRLGAHELHLANAVARAHINEAVITEWLISLHDNEKLGNTRLNRVMDEFENLYLLVDKGIFGFENYYLTVKESTGLDLNHSTITQDKTWEAVKVIDAMKEVLRIEQQNHAKSAIKANQENIPTITESTSKEIPVDDVQRRSTETEECKKQIIEPDDYATFPCPRCADRERCRAEKHRNECTCLSLYKEVLKERKRFKVS